MIFVGTQMPLDANSKQLYPGDPVEQAKINMSNIDKVMRGFGADLEDVYNINTRYVGYGTAQDWARAADIRANIWKTSGKNGTGVPVTDLLEDGMTIRQEVTSMLGLDGRRLSGAAAVFPQAKEDVNRWKSDNGLTRFSRNQSRQLPRLNIPMLALPRKVG